MYPVWGTTYKTWLFSKDAYMYLRCSNYKPFPSSCFFASLNQDKRRVLSWCLPLATLSENMPRHRKQSQRNKRTRTIYSYPGFFLLCRPQVTVKQCQIESPSGSTGGGGGCYLLRRLLDRPAYLILYWQVHWILGSYDLGFFISYQREILTAVNQFAFMTRVLVFKPRGLRLHGLLRLQAIYLHDKKRNKMLKVYPIRR